jgi:hypothetical protein
VYLFLFLIFSLAAPGPSPGATQSGVLTSFLVATIFQYYLFNYQQEWWKKYNYILAIALDTGQGIGVFIAAILNSFGVHFPSWAGKPVKGLGGINEYCHTSFD